MPRLLDNLARVESVLSEAKDVGVFLDFDGTLAPFAATPGEAELPAAARADLTSLSRIPRVRVAVVSGRELGDLKRKVGLRGISYAGSHGMEYELRGSRAQVEVPATARQYLQLVKREMQDLCRRYSGALVEDKGLSLALHYRQLKDVGPLEREIRGKIREYKRDGHVLSLLDAFTWDVRVNAGWTKADAVSRICASTLPAGSHIVYVGDSATDEDVFTKFADSPHALTVKVGLSASKAHYFVNDPSEVQFFLEWLLEYFTDARSRVSDALPRTLPPTA